MTISELATTPEIILFLLSLMLTTLVVIAGLIARICKHILPIFITFKAEFEAQRAECSGNFNLIRFRLDDHEEQIDSVNKRVGAIEIDLKNK